MQRNAETTTKQQPLNLTANYTLSSLISGNAANPSPMYPPPPVKATVNDQKLTEPTPSVAWTRDLADVVHCAMVHAESVLL